MDEQGKEQALTAWERIQRFNEKFLPRILKELQIEADASQCSIRSGGKFSRFLPNSWVCVLDGPDFERQTYPAVRSYLFFASRLVRPWRLFELSPRTTGLKQVLQDNWEALLTTSPVLLADFILTMQDVSTVGHEVLTSLADIENQSRKDEGFVLSDRARQLAAESDIATTTVLSGDTLHIRAVTLFGWMHKTQDLGITEIKVAADGDVHIADRETLCDPTFAEMPMIWY